MAVAVERYTILDEIGHGGMATVYRARDTTLDRLIALKVLHPHLQRTPEARARFTREAKSVAKLRHPNILEIFDYSGEGSAQTFIATELLTGPTLKDYVLEGVEVPAEVAACITLQVAEALERAHQEGIIHRDVKPENVLLHENKCVKLTDFGIAHMSDAHTFTATGQVLGSPGHMAPEQVETGHCDARSDVFSLGTVLYFVSVGRLPFIGRNAHHLLKQLLEGDYPDPMRLRPAIGKDLKDIIDCALALNPDDRYQDASAFADALRAFLGQSGVSDPQATLEAYLSDPDVQRDSIRLQAVEALLARASSSTSHSDIPEAHAALNRVLALDDGNERALKLLAKLGRRGRVRRRLAVLLALLGVAVFGAIGYAAWNNRSIVAAGNGSLGGDVGESSDSAGSDSVGAGASVGASDGGSASASVGASDGGSASASDSGSASDTTQPDTTTTARADAALANRPRLVIFKPNPQNVAIGIDGKPAREFGPNFNRITLKPGPHTIKAIGGEGCCKPYRRRVVIPPGRSSYELEIKLKFQNARLYLIGPNPPGVNVQITVPGGRSYSGKVREIFSVPMRSLTSAVQLTVQAPGYKTYRGKVDVRAGGNPTQHRFNLEETSETP